MKDRHIRQNMSEYGENFHRIRFASGPEAKVFEKQRRDLIEKIDKFAEWGFNGTKADCRNLSEGCRMCGAGLWSCLFINGRCNCKCFYCPASQDEECLPTTNAVSFENPADYTAYLKHFGFRGASISGGEPLLTPELTLSYISEIKKELGSDIYLWMYTNGSLATREIMISLRDAGLDEVRFDIGATGYDLSGLRTAVGVIPVVTVEIPAVPEEKERLMALIPELAEMGVNHLNLHQLRLTPYNFERFMKRDYTYISDESVTVIESELTALELICFSKESGAGLPVNYCSFPYKNRYQGLASRKRSGGLMLKSFETMTDNGYIRQTSLSGDVSGIAENITDKEMFELSRDRSKITLHPDVIPENTGTLELSVSYSAARQLHFVSYRNPFKTVRINDKKDVIIERYRVSEDFVFGDAQPALKAILSADAPPELRRFENTAEGLLSYEHPQE